MPLRCAQLCLTLLALAGPAVGPEEGLATISEEDLEEHLWALAAPELEGRDTPSSGLDRAAAYLVERFEALGIEGAGAGGAFRMPFRVELPAPDPANCELAFGAVADAPEPLELGREFVPLPRCTGSARGDAVFVGFGITGERRYDDLARLKLRGKVAVLVEGEPRHSRMFEGSEVTAASDVYAKLAELEDRGVVGAVVVRRRPWADRSAPEERGAPPELGYRYTWAHWNPSTTRVPAPEPRAIGIPVCEVSGAIAERMLGQDVLAIAARIDKRGKPQSFAFEELVLSVESGFRPEVLTAPNVVGLLRGTDPDLADEYLVIGAHYDHVGVDTWGRIGAGADDNASGTSALLELAEALAVAGPRRSVIFCAFAGEEDGLLGSRAFCQKPPVPLEKIVAMINMDMLGRGDAAEVVVLGTEQNPALEDLLARARKLGSSRMKRVITDKAEHLWQRSDHYSFHKVGIPSLFFFEAVSETKNRDYHTYRDTIDLLSLDKIARSTRLVFKTAWLITQDEERPPPPRG